MLLPSDEQEKGVALREATIGDELPAHLMSIEKES
jgi:hypothetical protein